jgi:hypothetical protein
MNFAFPGTIEKMCSVAENIRSFLKDKCLFFKVLAALVTHRDFHVRNYNIINSVFQRVEVSGCG